MLIAVMCSLAATAVAQPLPDPIGPRVPLRIVSLDLGQAPAVSESRPAAAAARPSWRTSFGSEIRNEMRRKAPPSFDIEADVVLLQGLTSIREARRFFPARFWKLVASRDLVGRGDPESGEASNGKPVTAVAVRFQKGLRVTGQDHLSLGAGEVLRATAVRVLLEDRMLWLVSASFEADCLAGPSGCQAEGLLRDWRSARRASGELTIAGGNIGSVNDAAGSCGAQWIDADPVTAGTPAPEAGRARTDRTGCFSRLDIGR